MAFSTYQYARMANQLITVTTAVTLFTVPASTQYIVKDINIVNNSAGVVTLNLLLVAGVAIAQNLALPAASVLRITGLFVLGAAETMSITVGTANAVGICINGQTGQ